MEYELTPRAKADIKNIIKYTVQNFGPQQADEYVDGLYYSFDLLTDNPRMGQLIRGRDRRYVYRSHYVFYRVEKSVIKIATIWHTKKKLPKRWEQ